PLMRVTIAPTRVTAKPARATAQPTGTAPRPAPTMPQPMRVAPLPMRRPALPTPVAMPPMRVRPEEIRRRPQPPQRSMPRRSPLRGMLERSMLQISVAALIAGSLGWSWLIYSEFRSPVLVAPAVAAVDTAVPGAEASAVKTAGTSAYVRIDRPSTSSTTERAPGGESAASIVAREFSFFDPKRLADSGRASARPAAKEARPGKEAAVAKEAAVVKEATTAKEPKIARD